MIDPTDPADAASRSSRTRRLKPHWFRPIPPAPLDTAVPVTPAP